MRIEFDVQKNGTNKDKHGVAFEFVTELDWESSLVWVDERSEYGEIRMIALAPCNRHALLCRLC